jgi:hypothetical protein
VGVEVDILVDVCDLFEVRFLGMSWEVCKKARKMEMGRE